MNGHKFTQLVIDWGLAVSWPFPDFMALRTQCILINLILDIQWFRYGEFTELGAVWSKQKAKQMNKKLMQNAEEF